MRIDLSHRAPHHDHEASYALTSLGLGQVKKRMTKEEFIRNNRWSMRRNLFVSTGGPVETEFLAPFQHVVHA